MRRCFISWEVLCACPHLHFHICLLERPGNNGHAATVSIPCPRSFGTWDVLSHLANHELLGKTPNSRSECPVILDGLETLTDGQCFVSGLRSQVEAFPAGRRRGGLRFRRGTAVMSGLGNPVVGGECCLLIKWFLVINGNGGSSSSGHSSPFQKNSVLKPLDERAPSSGLCLGFQVAWQRVLKPQQGERVEMIACVQGQGRLPATNRGWSNR